MHIGFKDITDVIKKHTGEDSESGDKPQKSKDARAFELFLYGGTFVAIELELSAEKVEELYAQYWRLSNLYNLEIQYHEAEHSLSLLLRLHSILKDRSITKDKDISDLELANCAACSTNSVNSYRTEIKKEGSFVLL